jgi:hypothetical protein
MDQKDIQMSTDIHFSFASDVTCLHLCIHLVIFEKNIQILSVNNIKFQNKPEK